MSDETTHADELIVDARHRDVVVAALTDLGVWPEPAEERSPDLDLVLLRDLRLDAYAQHARRGYANEIDALESVAGAPPFSDLDVLLHDLRDRFAAAHGYVPLLGKNRDAVIGSPQHKGGAVLPRPFPRIGDVSLIPADGPGLGIRIGIVDTPLAPHALLPAEIVDRDEEVDTDGPLTPWAGHATFVAGLIREKAPRAHLAVRAGLRADDGENSAWVIAQKIAGLRGAGIDLLNLSLGCETLDQEPPLVLRRALEVLGSDVLVVAAAGNRGIGAADHRTVWPAAATAVVAVGADPGTITDPDGSTEDATFSTQQKWVDLTAPGIDVASTYLTGKVGTTMFDGFARWTGTSFATATVTGAIAALMSTGTVSAPEAVGQLKAGADPDVRSYVLPSA